MDSHWSKSFVCCPVIGQETSKIMIAASIMILTVANLYYYFLHQKTPANFRVFSPYSCYSRLFMFLEYLVTIVSLVDVLHNLGLLYLFATM